jgi:EpsI family protein
MLQSSKPENNRAHFKPHSWLPLALLALGFVVLFHPALRELARDWTLDANYEHGFLVPIIAGYLLWQKRGVWRNMPLQPSFGLGLTLSAIGFVLYTVANAGAEWFIARAAMLLTLYGLVIYFAGLRCFRQISAPLLYLGFMIPLPYVIYYRLTFPLQQIASTGAFRLLSALGLAGRQEGNILHFSGFSLEVIEACSGLRSIMVLVTLAALMAYLTMLPNRWRWVLFLSAVPVAIIANIFRLIILALLGVFISPEAAMSFLHEGSGVLVFLTGLFLLMLLAGGLKWSARNFQLIPLLRGARGVLHRIFAGVQRELKSFKAHHNRRNQEHPPQGGNSVNVSLGSVAIPLDGEAVSTLKPALRFSSRYWLMLGLIAFAFAANSWLRAPKPMAETKIDLRRLAPELPGWRHEELGLSTRAAEQLKADQILVRNYYDGRGRGVEFFAGYYQDQQFGAQVHSPLHCLPGAGWTILRNEKFQLPFTRLAGAASRLDISKKNGRQFVVYWFVSDGEIVKNEMELKVRLLRNTLQRRATSVYFYRVCAAYQENDPQTALALLQDFLKALGPLLSEIRTGEAQ